MSAARDIRAAYEATARAWDEGPARVYRILARALVAQSPISLTGASVLDLGAGTGAVSEAVARAGGRAIAADLADAMLRRRAAGGPGAVGDALALPFRNDAFDAVAAAFVLNHLADPRGALGEAARVTRPGGAVLTSTFANGDDHPAKAAVEDALRRFGFEPPPWSVAMHTRFAPAVGDEHRLERLAEAAGLAGVRITRRAVDVGLDTPAEVAAWRLGMATTAPFLASLPPIRRAEARVAVLEALAARTEPVVPVVLLCAARVPG